MFTPCTGESCIGDGRTKRTDGFDARRLVPDSDSRDCFWLLVPHSSMAASTVTDPSSQGAPTRHAARRRGSDTRHDDASLLGSHRLILGGWDQEGGVDACAEVVAPSVTSQRTRSTRTEAPRRGRGHAGAPVRHGRSVQGVTGMLEAASGSIRQRRCLAPVGAGTGAARCLPQVTEPSAAQAAEAAD